MKRILVLEDDKRIAAALEIRLRDAGYEVTTASDGLKGLTMAMRIKPDLIISDIWLPSAVGFLVAERLKSLGLGEIPIIFITASKKEELWRLAQEVGAAAFFEKPYDPEKLLRAISRALGPAGASEPESASCPAGNGVETPFSHQIKKT